jgi:hypothetical protein
MDWLWDWLARHIVFRREWREMDEDIADAFQEFDAAQRRMHILDQRIRASFTDDEWQATKVRCERRLAEMGY